MEENSALSTLFIKIPAGKLDCLCCIKLDVDSIQITFAKDILSPCSNHLAFE